MKIFVLILVAIWAISTSCSSVPITETDGPRGTTRPSLEVAGTTATFTPKGVLETRNGIDDYVHLRCLLRTGNLNEFEGCRRLNATGIQRSRL